MLHGVIAVGVTTTMSKSTGLDAEASELRQRLAQDSPNVPRQQQAASVESLVTSTKNGSDTDKPKSNSKTYGRTPDGTGK